MSLLQQQFFCEAHSLSTFPLPGRRPSTRGTRWGSKAKIIDQSAGLFGPIRPARAWRRCTQRESARCAPPRPPCPHLVLMCMRLRRHAPAYEPLASYSNLLSSQFLHSGSRPGCPLDESSRFWRQPGPAGSRRSAGAGVPREGAIGGARLVPRRAAGMQSPLASPSLIFTSPPPQLAQVVLPAPLCRLMGRLARLGPLRDLDIDAR